MKFKIYLDTSAIKAIPVSRYSDLGQQIYYSRATLLDLKNDTTDSYLTDIGNLINANAILLGDSHGKVVELESDPMHELKIIDRNSIKAAAHFSSFANGGGPERSILDSLHSSLETILEGEQDLKTLLQPLLSIFITPEMRKEMSNITARNKEQGIDLMVTQIKIKN